MFSNIFYFHPYLGKWSNLANIFQRGWNHQLDKSVLFFPIKQFQAPSQSCRASSSSSQEGAVQQLHMRNRYPLFFTPAWPWKSPCSIGHTSRNSPFSIAMLVYSLPGCKRKGRYIKPFSDISFIPSFVFQHEFLLWSPSTQDYYTEHFLVAG